MNENLKLSTVLSILLTLIGITLIIYMITVEGELGALPLFVTITGLVWLIIGLRKRS